MSDVLGQLLTQGIKGIATQKQRTIAAVQDDLAYRCAAAVSSVETLSGYAIQKWRSESHIPRPEYVDVLARACVHEGKMGKSWLKSFLHQARYYGQEELAAELFPDETDNNDFTVLHNLPQPDHGRFIGRQDEMRQVRQLLRPYPNSVHSVIVLKGVGGVGKTTLALETARRFLQKPHHFAPAERFAAIIWFSGKETALTPDRIRPRLSPDRSLEDLYTVIALTLRQPALLQEPVESQHRLIRQALARQRTLIILDNLETVDDERLESFLLNPPAPSKVLITTRHWISVAFPVELGGMVDQDARDLVELECDDKDVSLTAAEKELLLARTGKVPLAMAWTIGRIGYGLPVAQVLEDLRDHDGHYAHFCFQRSVAEIRDRPAYRLLMALVIFGGEAERDALGYVAGLEQEPWRRDHELNKLVKLSLISRQGHTFSMLPLTREYALQELKRQPTFDEEASIRWVTWLCNTDAVVSDCYRDEETIFHKARGFIAQAEHKISILNAQPREPSLEMQLNWIRYGRFPDPAQLSHYQKLINRVDNARRFIQRHGYYDQIINRAQESNGAFQYIRVVQSGDLDPRRVGYDYLRHFYKMTAATQAAREQNTRISVRLYKGAPVRNTTFVIIDDKYILIQENKQVDGVYIMDAFRVIHDPGPDILETFQSVYDNVKSHSTEVSHANVQTIYEKLPPLEEALVDVLWELIQDLQHASCRKCAAKTDDLLSDLAANPASDMQRVREALLARFA